MADVFDQVHQEEQGDIFDQIHAGASSSPTARPRRDKMSLKGEPGPATTGSRILDAFAGAGSGLINTLTLGGKLLPEGAEKIVSGPDTAAGKVGRGIEQAAEYLAPIGPSTRGLSLIPRMGMEAGKGAVISGIQSGGDPEAVALGAAGGAGGTALEAGLQRALPVLRNRLSPRQQEAIDWAKGEGVPMSAGQQSGNQMTTKMERGLENTFGSGGRAQEFFADQEQALAGAGRRTVDRTQPGRNMNPYEAGQQLSRRVQDVIADAKTQADDLYSQVRRKYAANPQTVQTGSAPTGVLDASGQPVMRPMTQTFELPIDITNAKARLKPIYDELARTMPEAKRQASPGYQALREIIEGPDVMDAVTADRNLSAIKGIARSGNNQFLNSRSQGLAKQAIEAVTNDFNSALQAADPDILPMLTKAREAVRKQHTIAEILHALPDEPSQLYQRLTAAGDRTYNDLAFLNQTAPKEMRQIGRTFLDGLFDKATAEGGFQRAAGVMRDWQRLGPNTKRLLFGGDAAVRDLDNFFLAAKQLTADPNPSGTAKLISSLGLIGAAIDSMRTPGTLQDKAERFGMDAGTMAVSSNLLARLLLTPRGARLLTTAMTQPPASAAFRQSVNEIRTLLAPPKEKPIAIDPDNLPHYAKGGVAGLNGPEVALVGEEGPEAIVPLTAAAETVPEKPVTLKAQLEQLAAGDRRVVMFPRGSDLLPKPRGMKAYQDENGNTFIFDPAKTSAAEIDAAIEKNALPDLLGAADGGMGAPDKSRLSRAVAVVGRNRKGQTVQATAADRPHLRTAIRQTRKVTPPGGRVSVEPASKEIARRLDLPEPIERTGAAPFAGVPWLNRRPLQWWQRARAR